MRYFILVFSLFLLLAQSCSSPRPIPSGSVVMIDSIETHIDRNQRAIPMVLKACSGKDSLLLIHNRNDRYILLYDIRQKAPADSINLKPYTGERYTDIFMQAGGTVYILEKNKRVLKKINLVTKQVDSFRYNSDSCVALETMQRPFQVFNDSIFYVCKLTGQPVTKRQDRMRFFSSRLVAKMVIRDTQLVLLDSYCPFPEAYTNGDYNDYEPNLCETGPDELIYMFNDARYFYRMKNNEVKVCTTGLDLPLPAKIAMDSLNMLSYNQQYQLKNLDISLILFNPGKKNVQIYYKPPAKPITDNGDLRSYIDCDNFMVECDFEGHILKKYALPKNLDFRQGVLFGDELIWKNVVASDRLVLYKVKLQ